MRKALEEQSLAQKSTWAKPTIYGAPHDILSNKNGKYFHYNYTHT
jgi:hypothetical protein